MDQKKIGSFLKELRKEKGISQEAFAEKLNVTGRTVSRWETGANMPDISLLVEIADFYDVSIPEIINGERKSEIMEKEVREVAEAMSDYAEEEKKVLLKRVKIISIVGLIALIVESTMDAMNYNTIPVLDYIKGSCISIGIGALIVTILYTTGVLAEVRRKKSKHMKVLAIFCWIIVAMSFIASIIATVL